MVSVILSYRRGVGCTAFAIHVRDRPVQRENFEFYAMDLKECDLAGLTTVGAPYLALARCGKATVLSEASRIIFDRVWATSNSYARKNALDQRPRLPEGNAHN